MRSPRYPGRASSNSPPSVRRCATPLSTVGTLALSRMLAGPGFLSLKACTQERYKLWVQHTASSLRLRLLG